MYLFDAKLNFQHHYSSVSQDPSEIILICWFAVQETIIIKVENSCAAQYFCGNCDIPPRILWKMENKKTAFIWNKCCCFLSVLSLLISLMYSSI